MHPGTAREEKYWKVGRWARVLDYLAAGRGMPVAITGGSEPGEEKHIGKILQRTRAVSKVTVLAGRLDLLETAAVILSGHPAPLREEEFARQIDGRSMDAIAVKHVIGAIESLD